MSRAEAVFRYKAAMAEFKRWRVFLAITDADLLAISTTIGGKYGLSSCSIYLDNDLLCKEKRVIYGSAKGDRYEQKNNET